ncbi:hypothetical protein L21SP3_00047 [Sedimentisphaera cyanobacteriorum]|uniref:Ice-binding protein C-terminal domain-containing protein n=1 Tax=Sedimentisphaera cyanobacteriorum TaxID=1940790 RepID=A0A1Q2HLY1_9BACT|nr:PEP-CTERM sorting domain-containing protein [Sedimentisphaera cyanobacteriorum]AQQ08271.1 hypothetical protein L21SP3_00047 [Sedimentisphaera cyanobacteriorum]
MKNLLFASVFTPAFLQQAYCAGIIMEIYPEDGDVLAVYSGSLDLTGFYNKEGSVEYHNVSESGNGALLFPSSPIIQYADYEAGDEFTNITDFDSTIASFGTGEYLFADSFEGDTFALFNTDSKSHTQVLSFKSADINENNIVQVSGSATFENSTISGLGLDPGTYEINDSQFADGENFKLTITPEPATLALLGLGGAFIRKRRA